MFKNYVLLVFHSFIPQLQTENQLLKARPEISGEIYCEMPLTSVETGISQEISPSMSNRQLTLSLWLGNKTVKCQFLIFKWVFKSGICKYFFNP